MTGWSSVMKGGLDLADVSEAHLIEPWFSPGLMMLQEENVSVARGHLELSSLLWRQRFF